MRLSAQALGSAGFVRPMMALGRRDFRPRRRIGTARSSSTASGRSRLSRGAEPGLWSRNRKALDYPEIARRLESLRCSAAVLDGAEMAR